MSYRSWYRILAALVVVSGLSLAAPVAAQAQGGSVVLTPSGSQGLRPSTLGIDILVEPQEVLPLTAECIDPMGVPVPFCRLVISVARTPLSGGHDHDDASRLIGSFTPGSGNSGANGFLDITYTAPRPSGTDVVTLTGETADGTQYGPGIFMFGIQIGGLGDLGAGTNYILTGATPEHGDNHYGTASFNSSLVLVADGYAAAFPGSQLSYNDISLVHGGLFDISGAWLPPHISHRLGVDIDIGLVPMANRGTLRQLILQNGISTVLVEGNHWHLRQ